MNNENNIQLHSDELEVAVNSTLMRSCKEGNFDAFFEAQLTKDLYF